MFAPKNILVPTDFSEHSDRTLRQAVDLAVQSQAKIYLLHVVEGIQQCAADYCLDEEVVRRVELDSAAAARIKMKEQLDRISRVRGGGYRL